VETADGSLTIRHPDANECYHATEGAALEAKTLYIHHSGIKERFANRAGKTSTISVLDVGMGLAYNALSTIDAWNTQISSDLASTGSVTGGLNLNLVSLEINAELVKALARSTAPWQKGWPDTWIKWAGSLRQRADSSNTWQAKITRANNSLCTWTVVVADATDLNLNHQPFEYIWQDPFSPARNPTLWTAKWFAQIKAVSAPHATLMTYSVARVVKDALAGGGWQFERFATGQSKRHWLRASPL
jgi:tRNA U34 5-methylaminomethyl-2-thiouridine-forming methyltransferase MnmC